MKKYIRTTIIAALLVGLTAAPAHADDEALAAFGGFVVGMITGAIIENNSDQHHAAVEVTYGHHRDYRGHRCGTHNRYGCNACFKGHKGRKGHWTTQRYKAWVPGHWTYVHNGCGDRIRVWKSGYHTYRTKRVWVSRHHRNDRHYRNG
jgi:hypothetical protein